jgi:autotransporter-associated beta strand protein/uncharacterized repeat protein (TIGR03803 family)
MKNKQMKVRRDASNYAKRLRFIPAALGLGFGLLANHAGAAVTTWDPQGTVTSPVYCNGPCWYTGNLSQTWENNEWDTANETGTATPVNWVEGTAALFAVNSGTGTPAFTITMNANHTVAGIFDGPLAPNPCQVTIQGTGTMILPAGLIGFDVISDTSDPGLITIAVPITDAGGADAAVLTAEGTGEIFLNATNTYSGGTTLGYSGTSWRGILYFNNSASFGTGSLVISNTSTYIGSLAVEGTSAVTIPNPVVVGKYTYNPRCNIIGAAAPNGPTFSGNWTLNGANAVIGSATDGTVTISGNIADGPLGAGGFYMFNPGILVLSGVNTFSGNMGIGDGTLAAGTLEIGGAGQLGSGNYSGTIYITNRGTFVYASSANQTLAGVISSGTANGGGALTQNGPGTLTLTAPNTYAGATTINGGTLEIGGAGQLGSGNYSSAIVIQGGATLIYASSANQTLSGVISGGGALTQTGPGTLTLSAANTYTGATTLSGGALLVNGSTAAGSTVTVAYGATLGGSGAINGPLTVQSGGILAPGAGAAAAGTTLTLAGAVTLNSGCIVSNQINKVGATLMADKASSSGTLTLAGTLEVVLDSGSSPPANGDSFTLFGGTLAGSFASISTPPGFSWNTSGLTAGGNGTLVCLGCNGTLSVSAGANQTICNEGSTTLSATASGGSGSYTSYVWSPGGATTASILVSPASTTAYTVTVTDSYGCTATSPSVTVAVNPVVTANAGPNQSICTGCGVTIGGSPTAGGGSGSGYTYNWSPATGLSSATVANPTASPATTTTYTVTVTDSLGCSSTPSSVTLTVVPPPSIVTQPQSATNVMGTTATFTVKAAGSGLSYQWQKNGANLSGNSRVTGTASPTLTITGAVPGDVGSYTVAVSNLAGSTNSVAAVLTITIPPQGTSSGVVYAFQQTGSGPMNPFSRLLQTADGTLYGTSYNGGTNGYGTVFQAGTNGGLPRWFRLPRPMAQILMRGWCRAATAISTARPTTAGPAPTPARCSGWTPAGL